MTKTTEYTELRIHIIEKYRQNIASRYQYETLKTKGLPSKVKKQTVDLLRAYFLEDLYPEAAQREKLDAAFTNLQNYVKSPAKVFDLLGNLTSAIFQFGLQLPAAIKAGLVSLEAYTAAVSYEAQLTKTVAEQQLSIPISDEQLLDALTSIPENEIEKFIVDLQNLFFTFTNTSLLDKTILIMKNVIGRMKNKPELYEKTEIEGMELGLSIMTKGYDLFVQYDDDMKKTIVEYITANERAFLAEIRERRKK